jgi:hypothetical protein
MSRIRFIKPEFFVHEEMAELSPAHRLLFIGLWTVADREGRLEDRPKRLKVMLCPWDDCDVDAMLDCLDAAGFIQRYEADGEKYIAIPAFSKHQRPHPKEAASTIPAPASREKKRLAVKRNGRVCASTGNSTASKVDSGFWDTDTDTDTDGSCAEASFAPDPEPASPVVATLPCVGTGAPEYPVTQQQVDDWREAFPGVDVLGEVRKARAWLEANPTKRKTARGMPRFLVAWLGRAQDRGRAPPMPIGAPGPPPEPMKPWDPNFYAKQEAAELARRGIRD